LKRLPKLSPLLPKKYKLVLPSKNKLNQKLLKKSLLLSNSQKLKPPPLKRLSLLNLRLPLPKNHPLPKLRRKLRLKSRPLSLKNPPRKKLNLKPLLR